jgi:hypothetical protein
MLLNRLEEAMRMLYRSSSTSQIKRMITELAMMSVLPVEEERNAMRDDQKAKGMG